MKTIIVLASIFLSVSSLFGQVKYQARPFVIKGQLAECPEKYLEIFFKEKNGFLPVEYN